MTTNFRNVLKVYGLMRNFSPDDEALLNTLRGLSDTDREQLIELLGPQKRTTTKKLASKGASKSRRAASLASAIQGTMKSADTQHCTFIVNPAEGEACGAVVDDPIHDMTYMSSHQFQTETAKAASGGD